MVTPARYPQYQSIPNFGKSAAHDSPSQLETHRVDEREDANEDDDWTFASQTYGRTINDDQSDDEDRVDEELSSTLERRGATDQVPTNRVETNPAETNPVQTPRNQVNHAAQRNVAPTVPVQNGAPTAQIVPAAELTTAEHFERLPANVQEGTRRALTDAGFRSGTADVTNPLDDRYFAGYSPDRLQAAQALLASTVQRLSAEVYQRQLQSNGNQMDGLSALGGMFAQRTALNNFQLQMIEALNAIMNKVGHLIAEAARAH
jgi:hypothetical protein